MKVLTLFGTRPEIIKLAPVIRELEERPGCFRTVNVASGQHDTLLYPFARQLRVRIDHDLHVMEPGQTPNGVCSRVLAGLDAVLARVAPDALLVQGDTTTALAGALAAFHRRIPVGHVEAGLRSGDPQSPFPEEMNRRLVTRLATWHFAATPDNRERLLAEGVSDDAIFVTGNPVVDSLQEILDRPEQSVEAQQLIEKTEGLRRIVLTTHRRESFGDEMAGNLQVLRRFVEEQPDVALIFPMHPNPVVVNTTRAFLTGHPRIHVIDPLPYEPFIRILSRAWLIVSDSGGVQEEAPTLGKPLLVLRKNTERPEGVASGVARLVGGSPERLAEMLEEALRDTAWADHARDAPNPFGWGDAGPRIVEALARCLGAIAAPEAILAGGLTA